MVISMKKYSFLVYHEDYASFLETLQDMGVLHIVAGEGSSLEGGEQLEVYKQEMVAATKALSFFKHRKQPKQEQKSDISAETLLEKLAAERSRYEKLEQQLTLLQKDASVLEPWGEFSPEKIERLSANGIGLRFFSASVKKFQEEWLEQYSIEVVSRSSSLVYFVMVECEGEGAALPDAEELKLPIRSLQEVEAEQSVLKKELSELDERFDEYAACYIDLLQDAFAKLVHDLDFETARLSGASEVEDKLIVLQGWVPKTKQVLLNGVLEDRGTVYLAEDPAEGEVPPVLIKNGFFSRLFEPISKMFSLPAYTELDLTAAFAPFYMLFFGFCLGDAGYGAVIFLGTLIALFKVKKSIRPVIVLAMLLGISTMVAGVLTGTVFGMWLSETGPAAIKAKILIKDPGMIFYLSLGIGVVQILFGMLIQAVNKFRQEGFQASLLPIGWFIMTSSLICIMLRGSIPFLQDPVVVQVTSISIWVGVGLILLFNDIKANIFARIGKGIWELYNITGFFGDVLSYVRIFALGISSAILGLVINNIAGQISGIPVVGPVIFVLFVVVGHLGNILLSGLGSFVHPMRLTFVEFYKNAGFVGGGKKYKPFTYRKDVK